MAHASRDARVQRPGLGPGLGLRGRVETRVVRAQGRKAQDIRKLGALALVGTIYFGHDGRLCFFQSTTRETRGK